MKNLKNTKSALQMAKSVALKARQDKANATQVIQGTSQNAELAERPTTVFDTKHTGYNALDNLTKCPVCLADMVLSTVNTPDGREVPVAYCLVHRTCLPQKVQE